MRQVKFLINEAKRNTNTTDTEAITNELCVRLLNRSQEYIQAFLFTKNIESKIFRGETILITTPNIDTYDLPFDIYAKNSLNNIMYKNGLAYTPMKQIAEKSRGTIEGYFCSDSKIIIAPMPTTPIELSISYTKRLASLGISAGVIDSFITDTSITLGVDYIDMTDIDDYFCVVNSSGEIIKKGVLLSQSGAVLSVSDTSDIVAGMIVIPGKYATTHCQLPDELESSLIMSLETQIMARLSSSDVTISKTFGDDMLNMIGDMFSENTTDTFMPPIVEYSEWV